MLAVNHRVKRGSRGDNRRGVIELLNSAIDWIAGEIVVRTSDRGAPSYREEKDVAKWTRSHDTSGADGAPSGEQAGRFGFFTHGKAVIYWKAGTATHTSLDLTFYARTDLGDWVILSSKATLAPLTEYVVDGVGYRDFYVRITAGNGGAQGTVTINAAGA